MANITENNPTVEKLKSRFGADILKTEVFRNQLSVVVKRDNLLNVMRLLKDDAELAYDFLVDLTAVDYL